MMAPSPTNTDKHVDVRNTVLTTLREKGCRVTPQRETLLDLFFNLPEGEHVSVDEVHAMLQKQGNDISLATTYRTLKLFVSMGVIRELDFSEDHKHYELIRNAESPHHHIICVDCGKTAEFESPEVIQLAERIAKEKNLKLIDVQLKIYADCEQMTDDTMFHDHESMKKT
jgi:Fur family ferric uptake transcriptional regulator